MCGLAGFYDPRGGGDEAALLAQARRMADALRNRGPDDSGAWSDAAAGYAVGFRRLAIIDLSPAGHQPMVSANGRYVIAFNGEIYNFRDLRAELEGQGAVFRSQSDTEVVLEGCVRWGFEATLKRLNGMFAIALWDRAMRTVALARDRLGIKPLYFARAGQIWLFASQPGAFFQHPAWRPTLDRAALRAYFRFNYVPAPQTIWREAEKLAAGGWAVLRPDGGVERGTYWRSRDVARSAVRERDDQAAIEELEALLMDAVQRQMVADVPIGAFLSGGVDSSTVVALMQKASSRPVRTFTIGFDVPGFDESAHAAAVAKLLGTEHTELRVQPADALAVAPTLADFYDEPFADSSQIPTYLVAKLTREHVTVALSGDGGDECFAGYNRHNAALLWRRVAQAPLALRQATAALLTALPPALWDRLAAALNPNLPQPGSKLHKMAELATARDATQLYDRLVRQWDDAGALVPGAPLLPHVMDDPALAADVPDLLQRMQYLDLATYLPDDILAKVDRATMAVSLEARVPLLDHRVVEHAFTLKRGQRVRDGRGKWLLRQVLYRHVPAALIDRPKSGFALPVGTWLRGPLRDWAEDLLDERRLAEGGLDPRPVRSAWADHLAGRRDRQYGLWGVLMYESWRRRWPLTA
jgi:asparagine synthase (glutamine-hydrolysing)